MPGSRGNDPRGARPQRLAEWQAGRLAALRGAPPATVSYDDELPVDLLADPEETRRILDRIRAAE